MSDLFFRDDKGGLHLNRTYPYTFESAEPVCPICTKPIAWCLDMFSFTTGYDHQLAHARCVWTKEAFRREEALAPEHGDDA